MIHETLEKLQVPIEGLKPYHRNPRQGDVGAIMQSLEHHGQYRPIVVNARTQEVLAGNHTLAAARELGWTQIAATSVDVDDDQAARIVLVDNRANDLATYDADALTTLLAELADTEQGFNGTGFDGDDLDDLLSQLEGASSDDGGGDTDPADPPANPRTEPGDVWLLGDHRLMCGDARSEEDTARLLDRRVQLVFTSPPYASQRAYDESSEFRPIRPDDYVAWFEAVQNAFCPHVEDDGSYLLNIKEHCDGGQRHLYVKDLVVAHVREWGWMFVDEFCWRDTRNGVPGGWPNRFKDAWEPIFHFSRNAKIRFDAMANAAPSADVFDYSPDNAKAGTDSGLLGAEKALGYREGLARASNVVEIASAGEDPDHPAQFPVALAAWFLPVFTTRGGTVYDPFMGSGSTMLAAENMGRAAFGMEISPAYCDVIIDRWERHTGRTAEREAKP